MSWWSLQQCVASPGQCMMLPLAMRQWPQLLAVLRAREFIPPEDKLKQISTPIERHEEGEEERNSSWRHGMCVRCWTVLDQLRRPSSALRIKIKMLTAQLFAWTEKDRPRKMWIRLSLWTTISTASGLGSASVCGLTFAGFFLLLLLYVPLYGATWPVPGSWSSRSRSRCACLCGCGCVGGCVCVSVCVCVWERELSCVYVCVSMCVCVCVHYLHNSTVWERVRQNNKRM